MAACRLGSGLEGGVIVGVDDGEYASFAYKLSIGAEGSVQYIGMILSQDKAVVCTTTEKLPATVFGR